MNLGRRFKQAIKVLGPDCCSSIHDGRHGFSSILLQRVEPCPRFMMRWAIAISARPVFVFMSLMTVRWDQSLSDAEA